MSITKSIQDLIFRHRIKKYLGPINYTKHIVSGNLNQLVKNWRHTTEIELQNPNYLIEEYLNDLDGRNLIAKILLQFNGHLAPIDDLIQEIEEIDRKFIKQTISTPCIWGHRNEIKHHWNEKDQWWYYRLPKQGQFAGFN